MANETIQGLGNGAPAQSTDLIPIQRGSNTNAYLEVGDVNALAETSAASLYLPLAGGTLTGPILDLEDKGSQLFNVKAYGATGNGSTDDSTSVIAAIAACFAAGGGVIYFPTGTYLIASQILVPNDGLTIPNNVPMRFIGVGCSANGNAHAPTGGSVLNLTNNATTAKIDTRGVGYLEIAHMTLADFSSDSAAFVFTTSTVLHIHDCLFYGTAVGTGAVNDAIILGGTGTTQDGSSSSPFQGYGTIIRDNEFQRTRRAVLGQTYCNAVVIRDNNVWANCGSGLSGGAAIEFVGISSNANIGNVISSNLIELPNYIYGIKFTSYCQTNSVVFNNFFDAGVSTTAGIFIADATSPFNLVISGSGTDVTPVYLQDASGTTTYLTSHQTQACLFPQGVGVPGNAVTAFEAIVTNTLQINAAAKVNFIGATSGNPAGNIKWLSSTAVLKLFLGVGQYISVSANTLEIGNGTQDLLTIAGGTGTLLSPNTGSHAFGTVSSGVITADTGISRTAAGVLAIGNGAPQNTSGALVISRLDSSSADLAGSVSSAPTGIVASTVVVAVGTATATFTVTSTEGFTIGDTVNLSASGWTAGSGLASTVAAVASVASTTSMVLTYVSGGPWVAGTYSAQTGTLTQTGGTSVSVIFATAYINVPMVVVTPTSSAGAFYISAISNAGFTITYVTSGTQTFNYLVIGTPN